MTRIVRLRGSNVLHFWIPSMREVRQLPRFKELLREVGVVDHWNAFGWPEVCRPLSGSDFECP
jgi:hypothetical protein